MTLARWQTLLKFATIWSRAALAGAERVRLHLLETISRLSDFPLLGRPTDEPNVRVLVLTRYPYLLFYVIRNEVVILHVRHGSREPINPADL